MLKKFMMKLLLLSIIIIHLADFTYKGKKEVRTNNITFTPFGVVATINAEQGRSLFIPWHRVNLIEISEKQQDT